MVILLGLAGKTSMEQAMVDEIVDTCSDTFTEIVKVFFEKDETKKVIYYYGQCFILHYYIAITDFLLFAKNLSMIRSETFFHVSSQCA